MRHALLTAIVLLAGCVVDDNRLGGQQPLDSEPDSGAGSGGTAGAGGSGAAGSGGSSGSAGSGTTGSGGTAGTGGEPAADVYTAFVDLMVTTSADPSTKCMPRPLEPDINGAVPCAIAHVMPTCDCTLPGFRPPSASVVAAAQAQMQRIGRCGPGTASDCPPICVCEVEQLVGPAAEECRNSPTNTSEGWCYVDPEFGIGSEELVNGCPSAQKRQIRFRDVPTNPGINLIMCTDHRPSGVLGPERNGAIGDACIHWNETVPRFSGFSNAEVSIEIGSPQCSSGLCLANHFAGRVTCPYGQVESGQECLVPGSGDPVQAAVQPQDSTRRSTDAVYCSCRCAGPGPGPFCSCPQGYSCTPLVDDIGLAAGSAIAGSYCIKEGTAFDPRRATIPCDRSLLNCE